MKLLLIRHGETVDNVAQVYAGVTDSALTAHGVAQAGRLAAHLAAVLPLATHVFSSDLSRARRTAEAVLHSQRTSDPPTLVQLPLLREQDYGSLERCAFSRRNDLKRKNSGISAGEPGFRPVESRASVGVRASAFVDGYLVPILLDELDEAEIVLQEDQATRPQSAPGALALPVQRRDGGPTTGEAETLPNSFVSKSRRASAAGLSGTTRAPESVVFVVAHGMLLASLWRALLERFGAAGVALAPNITVGVTSGGGWAKGGGSDTAVVVRDLWHLGPWANTAYLELRIRRLAVEWDSDASTPVAPPSGPKIEGNGTVQLAGWSLHIVAINSREHLRGLKRTGGGVGSSAADENQRSIDSFFNKKSRTK